MVEEHKARGADREDQEGDYDAAASLGVSTDELCQIDDMLLKILTDNPDLRPEDLTPEILTAYMSGDMDERAGPDRQDEEDVGLEA